MGESSEWIEASGGSSKNSGLDSCEAHDVGFSPQEDRGGAEGKGWAKIRAAKK
jgi:hypothetical protein